MEPHLRYRRHMGGSIITISDTVHYIYAASSSFIYGYFSDTAPTMTFLQYESHYVCWRHYSVNGIVTFSHSTRIY